MRTATIEISKHEAGIIQTALSLQARSYLHMMVHLLDIPVEDRPAGLMEKLSAICGESQDLSESFRKLLNRLEAEEVQA